MRGASSLRAILSAASMRDPRAVYVASRESKRSFVVVDPSVFLLYGFAALFPRHSEAGLQDFASAVQPRAQSIIEHVFAFAFQAAAMP